MKDTCLMASSRCSDDTLVTTFTQAWNCQAPYFPLPSSSTALLLLVRALSIPPSLTGCGLDIGSPGSRLCLHFSPQPLSLTCSGALFTSKMSEEAKSFWSPSRPPPVVLALTMGSRPKAPYCLHDISVGLAGADSAPEPFSKPRKTARFRGSCCPASLCPPF